MGKNRPCFLVCPKCETKEWFQQHTPLVHCPQCGSPRHAELADGSPAIIWSDKSNWGEWAP